MSNLNDKLEKIENQKSKIFNNPSKMNDEHYIVYLKGMEFLKNSFDFNMQLNTNKKNYAIKYLKNIGLTESQINTLSFLKHGIISSTVFRILANFVTISLSVLFYAIIHSIILSVISFFVIYPILYPILNSINFYKSDNIYE